jgi:hypothetical protein
MPKNLRETAERLDAMLKRYVEASLDNPEPNSVKEIRIELIEKFLQEEFFKPPGFVPNVQPLRAGPTEN